MEQSTVYDPVMSGFAYLAVLRRHLRLIAFASGDFSFNLYWQSSLFYLLFFYTEVLGLPPALAGVVALAGSVWDGAADLAIALVVESSRKGPRWFVVRAAGPLGLSFIGLYVAPTASVTALAILALAGQLLFRTFYAIANVSYSAWSVRVSSRSADRGIVAGARMIFGALAALTVTYVTTHLPHMIGGHADGRGFFASAAVLAVIGTLTLLFLVMAVHAGKQDRLPHVTTPAAVPIRGSLMALARNRSFVTLNLAALASSIAGGLLIQSVLYRFGAVGHDARTGSQALATMSIVGAACVPGWMLGGRAIGTRATWLVAAALALTALVLFATLGRSDPVATELFLVIVQVALTGFNYAFWAMLPDTVEFGELVTGVRLETTTFGAAALLQKLGVGLASALIGLTYQLTGYRMVGPGTSHAAGTALTMVAGPALFIALSVPLMLANPLRRNTHDAIVQALAERSAG